MRRESFARIRDWVEPAHPGVIEQFEDLVNIYTFIRDEYQDQIDAVFDEISRQIGFIVTTTIPAILEIADKGKFKGLRVGAENLKGTLFERTIKVIKPEKPISARSGTYNIYLVWFDALRLKIHKDWVEPAHFRREGLFEQVLTEGAIVRPEVMEPAHWFDPGTLLVTDDILQILVLDQVYPELRLAERVSQIRQSIREINPEVMEPAHFRQTGQLR